MDSVWTQTGSLPGFEPLQKDLKTDVLIIGGGMAGLLCAFQLSQAGVDCALAEADRICGGITKNTTAKITSQHGLIYHKLIDTFGTEKARLYLEANQQALEVYRTLSQKLDCGFEEKTSFVYSLDSRREIEEELAALDRIGFRGEFTAEPPLPFSVAGAIGFPSQAQFHPLKFAAAIAKGLRIFEHTKVLELMPGRAVTSGGTVTAEKIIIATHFPMLNKHGGYFIKLYQIRSYVIALENAPDVGGMYVDTQEKGLSFRNYDGLLLLGGESHRTGKKGEGWQGVERFVRRYYPNACETARWAAQDCMSLDGIPYIGQYSRKTPNLYVASGFNKWGMTSSMAAALLLRDMVLGRDSPYRDLFSPSRTVRRPQLAINGLESVLGMLTPTVPRCPHMGCALKYNAQERSWDCPCHGSRFDENGTLLDNPATDDKRM